MKHTPGPWHADLREHYTLGGDMVEITLHDENGFVIDQIASVMLDTGEDSPEDRARYQQQEANARLIASAPDLLTVCTQVAKDLFFLKESYLNSDPRLANILGSKSAELGAVVANAEGRA